MKGTSVPTYNHSFLSYMVQLFQPFSYIMMCDLCQTPLKLMFDSCCMGRNTLNMCLSLCGWNYWPCILLFFFFLLNGLVFSIKYVLKLSQCQLSYYFHFVLFLIIIIILFLTCDYIINRQWHWN